MDPQFAHVRDLLVSTFSSGRLWALISHFAMLHWIDRKVIFTSKVPDPSSGHLKLVDSTCGYSPMWLLQNMFTEQCYSYELLIFNSICPLIFLLVLKQSTL